MLGVLAEYLASTLAGCVWNIGCLPRGLAGATCRRRLEQKEFLQRRGWNTGSLGIHQHGLGYGLHTPDSTQIQLDIGQVQPIPQPMLVYPKTPGVPPAPLQEFLLLQSPSASSPGKPAQQAPYVPNTASKCTR